MCDWCRKNVSRGIEKEAVAHNLIDLIFVSKLTAAIVIDL